MGIFVLGEKGRCVCLIRSARLIVLSLVLHQNNAAGHNSVWAKADQNVLDQIVLYWRNAIFSKIYI